MAAGLARREILRLLGTGAGVAALGVPLPEAFARTRFGAPRRGRAAGSVPSCVVRPQQMEGPFFRDEKLERSDIRSDPSDGSVRPGTPLALAFAVSRLDGALCSPFEGVLVDLWQCDAAGRYAGVVDGGFDTTGKQFLRGYQVTDAAGTASFVTIYPGWYTGRTVHIHFKLRTGPETAPLEFTSQLYFDDAASDVILAEEPYASRGERTVRNADDAIYRTNGAQLLLAVEPDGSGGYAATFTIGLQMDPEACGSAAGCVEALRAALPDESVAADARTRRTARRLDRRLRKIAKLLERAAGAVGPAQAARYEKARRRLAALLDAARHAADAGTLGVALSPIEATVETLLALLPA